MAKSKSTSKTAHEGKESKITTPTRYGSHIEMLDAAATAAHVAATGKENEVVLADDDGLYITTQDRVLRAGVKHGVADANRYGLNEKTRKAMHKELVALKEAAAN